MVFALSSIEWWVVAIAAAVSMGIGMLWYSPLLFFDKWSKLTKVKSDKNINMLPYMAGGYVIQFLQGYGLAYSLEKFNALGLVCAIKAALFLGILFVATQGLSGVLWSKKPLELFYIEVGCVLVSWSAMAAVFAYMA